MTGDDWARYWRADSAPVEAMHAHFTSHVYHRHSHESYSFGVTETGAQAFTCRNGRHVSGRGMVMAFNPDDPHDGHAAVDGGFTYRMVHIWPEIPRLADRNPAAAVPLAGDRGSGDGGLGHAGCTGHSTRGRPAKHQGLLGRNRPQRSLPEEVADSRGKPPARDPARDARPRLSLPRSDGAALRSAPQCTPPGHADVPAGRSHGYRVTMTLPTAPVSAAWWAAAMSASGYLCTGSPVSSPAVRAAVMSAAAWSSAVIGTP